LAVELEIHRAEAIAAAGGHEDALAQLEVCGDDARRLGSVHLDVCARTVAGQVRLRLGSETAGEVIEQALADARRIGYPAAVVANLCGLAVQRVITGRPEEGARAALDVLDQLSLSGIGSVVRVGLESAAAVLRHLGRPAWVDVATTARSLPPCGGVAGPPPKVLPECRGQRLVVRDAVALARRELREALGRKRDGDDAAAPAGADHGAVFRRSGDHWEIAFENRSVHLVDSKGMNDLAVLIAQPGREVHCVQLAGAAVEQPSTGEVIDASARRAYEARVRELQAELDRAEAEQDLGRAELARQELDALVDQLTTALGLARHGRRSAGTAERARTAVTQRIRSAIRRIADAHPTLGQHLQRSVRTGAYCCYDPDRPVDWVVVP
jgi:hypothetical protein